MALLASSATAQAATTTIKVMTYNTHHGGTASTPATTDGELDTIAAQNPDVVVMQEAYVSQLNYFVNGLNARLGTTAWHGTFARHCQAGVEPNCTTYRSETVMILTRLTTLAVSPRLIWAKDDYHVARATIRMSVALSDGTPVNVFVCHLPAQLERTGRANHLHQRVPGLGAVLRRPETGRRHFNDSPDTTPIAAMTQHYSDAWTLGGYGSGFTHMHYPSLTATSRIDYWFSDNASPQSFTSVDLVGDPTHSDHLGVLASYAIASTPTNPETTLMDERFDALDPTDWPGRVITGTQDSTIPVVSSGKLRIGSLKESTSGTHYYGISSGAYNLSNSGCAAVQLVTSPARRRPRSPMFAVVRDSDNLYRWYQSGNTLVGEKKVAGVKTPLVNLRSGWPRAPVPADEKELQRGDRHGGRRLRDGAEQLRRPRSDYRTLSRRWDARVGATSLKFELKAGTSGREFSPGSAYWDNFHAGVNCS